MKRIASLFAMTVLASAAAQAAPLVDLNTAGYFTYGNVNSYSMPLNGINIKSGPGQIKDQVVIYTGSNGDGVTTNVAGFDDAYGAPNGVKDQFAAMNTAADGGAVNMFLPTNAGGKPEITNNNTRTWDASLLAMKTFLDGDSALFLFNNNDTNEDQSLAIWAKLWITNSVGAIYNGGSGHSGYLYLSNEGAAFGAGGVPTGDATAYDGGLITDPSTGLSSTDYVQAGGNVLGVNHNLGADRVAYAGDIPLLNTWMNSLFGLGDGVLGGYTLHIELRLGCDPTGDWDMTTSKGCIDPGVPIDNGYEQLFLVRNDADTGLLPAPATLALVGLGLLGISLRRRVAA